VAPAYGIPPVAAFRCSLRSSGSTPPVAFAPVAALPLLPPPAFPGGNTSKASALRRSPGGSTPPVAYAPYDVPPVVALPLLPPPVAARL